MKRIKSITALASAVTALALIGNAHAESGAPAGAATTKNQPHTTKPQPVGEKAAVPGTDQAFLQKAAESNLYEIELGKIAEKTSTNPEIRKIAQDIVRNHTAANQQLEKLAASKGITLPSSPTKAQQQKVAALESKSGEQFDKAFMQDQVQNTQQTISTFERERSRTSDPEIKGWAESMLPRLKNHLSALQSARPEAVGEKNQKQPQKSKPSMQQPQKKGASTGGD